jgi:CRISPR/Cas system CSM-associated protein Csm3 (group 7 of RAMP superfamily)
MLFSEEVVSRGRFQLQIDPLDERVLPAWLPAVLRHVLRDLDDGLFGIGSRTTRGLGTVSVRSYELGGLRRSGDDRFSHMDDIFALFHEGAAA